MSEWLKQEKWEYSRVYIQFFHKIGSYFMCVSIFVFQDHFSKCVYMNAITHPSALQMPFTYPNSWDIG